MSYLKKFSFVICLTTLTACSNNLSTTAPSTESGTTAEQSNSRPIKIQGTTTIAFTLSSGSATSLGLTNSNKHTNKWSYPIHISFNDSNCLIGHQASITVKKNNEWHTLYFKNEMPWDKTNILTIFQGGEKKELAITLNGETISFEASTAIHWLKMEDSAGAINIHSID